ncbi:hypothetical protein GGF32_005343 [Allomyces javanicus]|nr:hypothetical protein GGF32_005343 [Allomyces javanicus]
MCEQFVQERIRLQNDRPGPTYLVLDCPGEYIFDSVGYAAIQASAKELGVTVVVMVSPDSIPWSVIGTFDTVTLDKYRHFTAGQKHGILGKYLKNTVDMMTLLRSWRQYRYYTVERV